MEMNTLNTSNKPEDNSDVNTTPQPDDKERNLAIDSIFYNSQNSNHSVHSNHDLFDKAGENDLHSDGGRSHLNALSNNNFDIRSDYGGGFTESLPDVNVYQHKKTVAQGMMDLALFSANANQLRYVLESNNHPYYYPGLILISTSLIFQVAVGVGLLWNTRYNIKSEKEICIANKINNFTIVGIFLVTVVNVFISAFGVAAGTQPLSPEILSVINRFGGINITNSTDLNSIFSDMNITSLGNFTDY